jgi:hypothetical protein
MSRKSIIGKYLAVGIILLFVGAGVVPSIAKPIHVTANTVPHPGNFFGLSSNIIVSWDANETEEPIIPRGPMRQVQLDISFWVTWGVFGRLIGYLLRSPSLTMQVSIIEKPEWCYAIISQQNLSFTIPREENNQIIIHDYLAVGVGEDAPAFEVFPVTIQTTVEPLHGFFGILTLMQGTTRNVNVTFGVAYKPLIQPFFPQTNVIETPPLVQVELPIGIKNLGNGKTIVENEVVDYPDGWIVSLPAQLVLEVGEYKEMNLSIVAPSDFSGVETIIVSFTPHSFDNYSLVGQTTYASFLGFYNPP